MKDQLTIVAKVIAKSDKLEYVKDQLLQLIKYSRTEKGCIGYNLLQDETNINIFVVYENWENEEAVQFHTNSVHFRAFVEATNGTLDEFTVNKMTLIS